MIIIKDPLVKNQKLVYLFGFNMDSIENITTKENYEKEGFKVEIKSHSNKVKNNIPYHRLLIEKIGEAEYYKIFGNLPFDYNYAQDERFKALLAKHCGIRISQTVYTSNNQ